jgi:hypothetical protein
MAVYLSLVSCILLAGVAGLLLMVGFQMRQMRMALKDAPTLGDAMGQQLNMAKEALSSLEKGAREMTPTLEKNVREAQMAVQDLSYLTKRAEEILSLLEKNIEAGTSIKNTLQQPVSSMNAVVMTETSTVQVTSPVGMHAPAPGVTVANEAAAREPGETVESDPLEALLAGLAAARTETPVTKKPTPPTAMELLMGVGGNNHEDKQQVNPLRLVADMQAMKRREKSQAEMDLQQAAMRKAG